MQYLRARYYDPTTGQFLTRDPLAAATGQPYAYANNSPLNYTDPSGEWALSAIGAIAGAVTGAVVNSVSYGLACAAAGTCSVRGAVGAGVGGAVGGAIAGESVIAAAEATGFPAVLIIFGIIGLLVAAGIALGGRRDRAKVTARVCAAGIVVGIILANVF